MPFSKEATPPTQPSVGCPWFLPSLFAAFNVVLLVNISGLFFAFLCRRLPQNGEWDFPMIMGLLFVISLYSLVFLSFSDPGILHQGLRLTICDMDVSEGLPNTVVPTVLLSQCGPPWTFNCPCCNICVEEFYRHCKRVYNCVGLCNIHIFLVLLLSLCFYLGTPLLTCVIFVRTRDMPFFMDKVMAHTGNSADCEVENVDSQGVV